MSLILNGTTGLSDVDGTAAAPAISGTDTNTGLFFGADIIGFAEGGVEAMRINASGVLTTTNDATIQGLTVGRGAGAVATNTAVGTSALASNTTASNSTAVGYQAGYNATGGFNTIVGSATTGGATFSGTYNTLMGYGTGNSLTTGSNNTFIGTLGSSNYCGASITTGSKNTIIGGFGGNQGGLDIRTASNYIVLSDGDGNPRGYFDGSGSLFSTSGVICFTTSQYRSNVASSQLQFINNSAGVSLAVNGTSWGSLSDERDKEIVEPITNAVNKVSTLRSVIGRYKIDDADKRRAFLIAQDVKAVLPEAVTELDDEQKTLILQYTEVIPLLVAAIKEQQALITALTTRSTALEERLSALEAA